MSNINELLVWREQWEMEEKKREIKQASRQPQNVLPFTFSTASQLTAKTFPLSTLLAEIKGRERKRKGKKKN